MPPCNVRLCNVYNLFVPMKHFYYNSCRAHVTEGDADLPSRDGRKSRDTIALANVVCLNEVSRAAGDLKAVTERESRQLRAVGIPSSCQC